MASLSLKDLVPSCDSSNCVSFPIAVGQRKKLAGCYLKALRIQYEQQQELDGCLLT